MLETAKSPPPDGGPDLVQDNLVGALETKYIFRIAHCNMRWRDPETKIRPLMIYWQPTFAVTLVSSWIEICHAKWYVTTAPTKPKWSIIYWVVILYMYLHYDSLLLQLYNHIMPCIVAIACARFWPHMFYLGIIDRRNFESSWFIWSYFFYSSKKPELVYKYSISGTKNKGDYVLDIVSMRICYHPVS